MTAGEMVNGSTVGTNLVGLGFSLVGSLFCGSSFVLNKMATDKLKEPPPEDEMTLQTVSGSMLSSTDELTPQNDIGYRFLKQPFWWLFILCTALGEACNFIAYLYAPATMVAPLGCLSMVVTCILSWYALGEKITSTGKLGIVLGILGSTMIIVNAPANTEIKSLEQLVSDYLNQGPFIVYFTVNTMLAGTMAVLRKQHFVFRILLVSFLSPYVVISAKTIGISIGGEIDKPESTDPFRSPFFYIFVVALVLCTVVNLIQLTMALSMAQANIVVPTHYVCFSVSIVMGTNFLFKEYEGMPISRLVSLVCGFGVLSIAVIQIQYRDKSRPVVMVDNDSCDKDVMSYI